MNAPTAHSSDFSTDNRLLAIGDIHGCLPQLLELVRQIAPREDDQVVFLGDYIDRGPDSAGVIEYLLDFRQNFPRTVFLRGNHEQMFLDFLAGKDPVTFLFNGGTQTLNSYQSRKFWPIPDEHRQFIENLPCAYETEDFIFVHAGLRPGLSLAEQSEEDLLWIRQDFLNSDYDWGKPVVFGHTPLTEPEQTPNRIGLDTGCVYGRVLTGCEVRTRQIWQA